MDIMKLKASEIRSFNEAKFKEAEADIREQLNKNRLDVYGNQASMSANAKKLRKSLARIKTVLSERRREASAKAVEPKEA